MSFPPCSFAHLSSHCWLSEENEFYKFLIFLISALIILFIFAYKMQQDNR